LTLNTVGVIYYEAQKLLRDMTAVTSYYIFLDHLSLLL